MESPHQPPQDLGLTINTVTKDEKGNVAGSDSPADDLLDEESGQLDLRTAGLGQVHRHRQRPLQ